jgi:hypothetical protein
MRTVGVALVVIGIAAAPVVAKPTRVAKCAAAKASAAGRELGGALGCESKARGKSVATPTACLDKANQRFESAFGDAGSECTGDVSLVRGVLDQCSALLTGDVAETGKCARIGLHALAVGGQGLGICAAKEALHAGKGAACRTKALSKLDDALGKASACTSLLARDHLTDCWNGLLNTLAATPTSTTATVTTTTLPPSTSTTSTTVGDTTTTAVATTSTTSSTETTTTTECASVAQCGGEDNDCQARACLDGICGFTYTPPDTVVTDQNLGNCRDTVCDGAGGFVEATNDADVPNDGNDCTDDLCTQGVPSNPPISAETLCDGGFCDGDGHCVECLGAETCPGTDTECMMRTCVSGACGTSFTNAGTPVAAQTVGDCHIQQCDGAGGVENVIDDTDADDQNECTIDACLGGTVLHEPLPDTTPCSGGECNGGFCCAIGQICG